MLVAWEIEKNGSRLSIVAEPENLSEWAFLLRAGKKDGIRKLSLTMFDGSFIETAGDELRDIGEGSLPN